MIRSQFRDRLKIRLELFGRLPRQRIDQIQPDPAAGRPAQFSEGRAYDIRIGCCPPDSFQQFRGEGLRPHADPVEILRQKRGLFRRDGLRIAFDGAFRILRENQFSVQHPEEFFEFIGRSERRSSAPQIECGDRFGNAFELLFDPGAPRRPQRERKARLGIECAVRAFPVAERDMDIQIHERRFRRSFNGIFLCFAAAAQSSNSGFSERISPSRTPDLKRIGPNSVSRVSTERSRIRQFDPADPDPEGPGFTADPKREFVERLLLHEHAEHLSGTALFHQDRGQPHIQRAGFHQHALDMPEHFRRDIIQIGFEQSADIGFHLLFSASFSGRNSM